MPRFRPMPPPPVLIDILDGVDDEDEQPSFGDTAPAGPTGRRKFHVDQDLSKMSLADLDAYGRWLQARSERTNRRDRVMAAAKTVSTFSRLMGKHLSLTNSGSGAWTDGKVIAAPFESPHFYELVEHEISHNLFQSNPQAKAAFCEQYVAQVSKALSSYGIKISTGDGAHLGSLVGTILNIIEDHRVDSLWAMLYPGSYQRLFAYSQKLVAENIDRAHENLVAFFLAVAYAPTVPDGPYVRFAPAMTAALKKVERKGPEATFVIGKWLMVQIVSEMIRISKALPPPPPAGSAKVVTDLDSMGTPMQGKGSGAGSGGEDGDDNGDNEGDGDADGDSDASAAGPNKDDRDGKEGSGKDGDSEDGAGKDAGDKDGGAAGEWTPPAVNATSQERVDAFKDLLAAARSADLSTGNAPMNKAVRRTNNEPQQKPQPTSAQTAEATKLVNNAYQTDVTDPARLDDFLAKSEGKMDGVIAAIQDALEQTVQGTETSWSLRNVATNVSFRDVENPPTPLPLSASDRQTSVRLREIFHRVKTRNAKQLCDDGVEVDIPALLARRLSGVPTPVFRADMPGRGFKILVLTDRSSSMNGAPSLAVERATRILRASLKLPNVEVHSWGFHGGYPSTVVITRVPANVDCHDAVVMPAQGSTPMASSLRVAMNWLHTGTEKKHLFLITDGAPDGHDLPDGFGKDSAEAVRREIRQAENRGVSTTTLVLGHQLNDAEARRMFGRDQKWKRVAQKGHGDNAFDGLTRTMVDLVSTSFLQYLKNG